MYIIGSVIVISSVRFESCNPNLSENHRDHLTPPSYTTSWDTTLARSLERLDCDVGKHVGTLSPRERVRILSAEICW